MKKLFFALLLCAGAFMVHAAGGPDIKPGNWQYSVKMEMPGLPFPMPPMNFSHCLTQKDIDEGKAYQSDPKRKDCRNENLKETKTSASYDMVCTDPPMTGHYDLTFVDNSFQAKGTINMSGRVMNSLMTGTRTGDCKK